MGNPSLQLGPTLPPGIYEHASGGRPAPPGISSSPVGVQNTGGAPSPVRPQHAGGAPGSGIMQPQRTGQSTTGQPAAPTPPRSASKTFSAASPTSSAYTAPGSSFGTSKRGATQTAQWDVTSEAKATSDRFFTQLDTQKKGTIEGEVAVPFMLQSQLDEGVLASIWYVIISISLADVLGILPIYGKRAS